MKHDRIIGRQFLEGNDDVCVYLYNSYADQLYAYGCGLGFDRETLKDAIHDVFLNLLARRRELGGVKNIRSYLFRAFYNRLIDFKRHECDTTELTPQLDLRITVSFADSLIDTEQAARLKTMLEHMLNELSPMQKSAIYMRYMYEMEYAEIAEILDVTPHAVRKFVSKGRSAATRTACFCWHCSRRSRPDKTEKRQRLWITKNIRSTPRPTF